MKCACLLLGTPWPTAPQHGSPAHRAAVDIAENASWADVPGKATDPWAVKEEEEMGRASRIVPRHDLARGKIQRGNMWEYITGITDAEREQMRAERLARGEPNDYDLWDDEARTPAQ